MPSGYEKLTHKEKEVLRLILQGHDAKSMAVSLELSVHTVNERLRNARRKLAVTSSKEAARLVFAAEGGNHEFLGHKRIRAADSKDRDQTGQQPMFGSGVRMVRPRVIGGIVAMSLLLATLFAALQPTGVTDTTEGSVAASQSEREVASSARRWLELSDAGDWATAYAATSTSFRHLNTLQHWTDTASAVRPPLGRVLSRELISVDFPPTPERYASVKFRTDFANRAGLVETMTLVREDDAWHVVGIVME
ncbi:helix-turn-helix domain-containing protein [Aurantiacibacter suaedae]|uniref:helix-turn-helix domain-containing protein n=1 Tax=Aurantiacibacter suaedae TaxID=2545755 RepID=UPI0010F8A4E7|nr:DUF4019 domain-containing protein [Aurantiacibacter suaedae]